MLDMERIKESLTQKSKCCGTTRDKHCLRLIVFAICSTILCVAAMAFVVYLHGNKKCDATNGSKFPKACVTCSMLLQNVYKPTENDTLLDSLPRSLQNKSLCCATDSDQMSTLFKLLLRSKESPKVLVTDSEDVRPNHTSVSAHKRIYTTRKYEGLTNDHFNEKDPFTLELNPNRTLPVIEHVNGVTVKQYGFLIQYTGVYYIYSSLYFSPQSSKQCKDFKHKTWEHTMYRVNDVHRDRNKELITGSHTCCDICHVDQETIYTGGIFEFHAGDMIGITVTSYGLVNFSKKASFTGLIMLGTISKPE